MSERDMRQRVVSALRWLDAVSVENPVHPGTPDVNYVEGWIELKWAREWPVRNGVLAVEHFSQQQKVWIMKRAKANGNVFLLLQVRQEWLMFEGLQAVRYVGTSDRHTLRLHAAKLWDNGLNDKELLEWVRNNSNRHLLKSSSSGDGVRA